MNQRHLLSVSGEVLHASALVVQLQPSFVVLDVPLSPYVAAFQDIETPATKIRASWGPPLGNAGKGCDRSPLPLLSCWRQVNDSASSHVRRDVCNSSTDCLGGHRWSAGGKRVSPVAKNTLQGNTFATCALVVRCWALAHWLLYSYGYSYGYVVICKHSCLQL